jgi:hypothetical protein
MKTIRTTPLLTAAVIIVLALALPAAASSSKATTSTTPPSHHSSHAREVTGTIAALNEKADDMKVRDAANKETEVYWTAETHVAGVLKVGEPVTARYLVKDGKNMATSIQVPAAPAAAKSK